MTGDPVHDVLGHGPVEFGTAGELAALLAQLPADTPVIVAHGIRIDPDLPGSDYEERAAAAARAVTLPQMVEVAGGCEQRPVPMVRLGAYYAAKGQPLSPVSVPVFPYERAVEAIHVGDDDAMFTAFGELLQFMAGSLDGQEDAALYQQFAGDADLVAQAELDAALLRHVAERLVVLHRHINAYLRS